MKKSIYQKLIDHFKKYYDRIPAIMILFTVILLIVRVWVSEPYTIEASLTAVIEHCKISVADGQEFDAKLPYRVTDLEPGTQVKASLDITVPANGTFIYLKSVYSPFALYQDGRLVRTYGDRGTFPRFFKDPPTANMSIFLSGNGEYPDLSHIEIIYQSPNDRSSVPVDPFLIGESYQIGAYLNFKYGGFLIISFLMLCSGIMLTAGTLCYLSFERRGRALLWPGLLALFAGLWELCENDLLVYVTHWYCYLYLGAYIGMYLLALPIIELPMLILGRKSRVLLTLRYIVSSCAIVAFVFQFLGIVSFEKDVTFFHGLLTITLMIIWLWLGFISLKEQNTFALKYLLAFSVIVVTELLELLNFYFHFTDYYSVIIQSGLFIFIWIVGVFSTVYMKNVFAYKTKSKELENSMVLMEQAINAQKTKNTMLLEHEEEIREQRHDLRHHVTFIQIALQNHKYDEALAYISNLSNSIPVNKFVKYCDNETVNSLLAHYVQIAEKEHIEFKINAVVPRKCEHVSDSGLCVIVGNLIENGIEACLRMDEGDKFVCFNSRVQGNMLFITVDNSFTGLVRFAGTDFISSKRTNNAKGTGTMSVKSLAAHLGGKASFSCDDKIFSADVYIKL